MNPRQLNRHINILRAKEIRDPAGQQQALPATPYHRRLPAMRTDTGGGEASTGQQVETNTDAVFVMRFLDDVKQTDQVEDLMANEVFDIVKTMNKDGKREWLWLECSKVNP